MTYNMSGSPYAMAEKDALTYGRPSKDPAASVVVSRTMDKVGIEAERGFRAYPGLL